MAHTNQERARGHTTLQRTERRRTRESFRLALARIAERIDEARQFEVTWNDWLLHSGRMHSKVRVRQLWVAGSFARGASSCGDLDLIVDVVVEEGLDPGQRVIARALLGRAPDVRLYVGTPEKNLSGIELPEARRIWSEADPNWRAAIDQIREDPAATRFGRSSDELPLRAEQVERIENQALEGLLDLQHQGILEWTFVELSSIALDEENWAAGARKFLDRHRVSTGRKTYEVLRHVTGLLQRMDPRIDWGRNQHDRVRFRLGDSEVRIGRPSVDTTPLDGLACARILLAPHKSRRGPNGVWIIRRGENHPLERRFSEIALFYHRQDGDFPALTCWRSQYGTEAMALDLFTTVDAAEQRAAEHAEAFSGEPLTVARVSGGDLLRLVARVDIVQVDDTGLPITRFGAVVLELDDIVEASPAELLDLVHG